MRCELFGDAGRFLGAAAYFLVENEAVNTVLLGAALRCERKAERAAAMAVVRDGDVVRLVATMRPPHALALSARGEMYLWAVGGQPVASAAFVPTTPAGDAGRINAVFTLEEERGRGYASACVAALSQRLLDRGRRYCLIFADRGNPITTRIYPRLGYQEVASFTTIGFHNAG